MSEREHNHDRQTELRDLQLYLLSALKDITKACDENGIDYMIAEGTALGAVRHKGFIPWDDDIDLYMSLKNYKKFLKIGQKVLGDRFFVQNYHTEKQFFEMWTQIRCKGTTSMPVYLKELEINWGICIDIFPIVGTSQNEIERKSSSVHWSLIECYYQLIIIESPEHLLLVDKSCGD